jgi:hypothetical protein
MSPWSSSSSGRALRRAVRSLLLVVSALAVAAPAAHATVLNYSFTDPSGDGKGTKAFDLTGGTMSFDNVTGAIKVTATTAVSNEGKTGSIQFLFSQYVGGVCQTTDADPSTTIIAAYAYAAEAANQQGGAGQQSVWATGDDNGVLDLSRSGSSITLSATSPKMAGPSPSCVYVVTLEPGVSDDDVGTPSDFATALPVTGDPGTTKPTTPGTGVVPPPPPVVTDQPDADHDGVPDALDSCVQLAGAKANGCPSMPSALELRLGAKRVVVDRLVHIIAPATGCPATVTVTVTSIGKTIGKGAVSVSQHGNYCRVYGVVKTKKHVKRARVVMKSSGLEGIAKSVAL